MHLVGCKRPVADLGNHILLPNGLRCHLLVRTHRVLANSLAGGARLPDGSLRPREYFGKFPAEKLLFAKALLAICGLNRSPLALN